MSKRTERLNSLLKQVINEVVRREISNPHVSELLTIAQVEITKNLKTAKVYVSVIGSDQERLQTVDALQKSSKFISSMASKKVVLRYFPCLEFILDTTVDKQMKITHLLKKIDQEKHSRDR